MNYTTPPPPPCQNKIADATCEKYAGWGICNDSGNNGKYMEQNCQLTCNKCKHQFGSVQALKKHVDGKKCLVHNQSNQILRAGLVFDESIQLTPYATGLYNN